MSAQVIALYMFWRKKEKKKTSAEILERKRQMLEMNWELESDEDGDNSKSRISNANDSMRESSFRGTSLKQDFVSDKHGYTGSNSELGLQVQNSLPAKQKWNILNNALNEGKQDGNQGLTVRKRSRGSTTDDKKTVKSAKSAKKQLRYDYKKYTAQKEKVIEARKAKFGIFKQQRSSNHYPQKQETDKFEMRDDSFRVSDNTS